MYGLNCLFMHCSEQMMRYIDRLLKTHFRFIYQFLLAYKKDRQKLVSIYIRYTLMMGENTFPGTAAFFNVLIYGKMIDLGPYSRSKMLKEDKK